MAIINRKTGFRGYTIDGGAQNPSDERGYVKRCLFSIKYPYHVNDVACSISNGNDDWGAQMGDGSIIPLSAPVILYQSKHNAVIQFDMQSGYPSNSPCSLVCRSDTASFVTTEVNGDGRPFTVNSASGNFAITVDEGNSDENGRVNTLIATFDYQHQRSFVNFNISTDPSHWGARMGDGTVVPLRDPVVISANPENAVVHFTMDTPYPSNSPCIIVYRSADASYEAVPSNDPTLEGFVFIPVTDITRVPESIVAGTEKDLSIVNIEPVDATILDITWSVISGPGIVTNDQLSSTGSGSITLEARVVKGGENREDFVKRFIITSLDNVIEISVQPYDAAHSGDVLRITAGSTNGIVTYQWYTNSFNSVNGASPISGETSDAFTIPESVESRYYFCRVSSPGAESVDSIITSVEIAVQLRSMTMIPSTTEYNIDGNTHRHQIVFDPPNYDGTIIWSTDNENVIHIDTNTGDMTIISDGTATITATEILSGSMVSKRIVINPYIRVDKIVGVVTDMETGTPARLTGTVEPSNATCKEIVWSIVDAGSTGAKFDSTGRIECTLGGSVIVRATITNGLSFDTNFVSDFVIRVTEKFVYVPVQDIILNGIDLNSAYETGSLIELTPRVIPSNATFTNVVFEALDSGITVMGSNILINGSGETTKIVAKIENGAGTENDMRIFSKEFVIKTKEKIVFIPVLDANIKFIDDKGDDKGVYLHKYDRDIKIPIVITPNNATNHDDNSVRFSLVGIETGECTNNDASIESVGTWAPYTGNGIVINTTNKTVHANLSALEFNHVYRVKIHVIVTKGASNNKDFEKDLSFAVIGKVGDMFIPLEGITYKFPSRLRCYYPILIDRYSVQPAMPAAIDKSTMKLVGIKHDTFSSNEDTAVNVAIVHPANDLIYHTVEPLPIFMFGFFELYLYPWNPGTFTLRTTVPNATVANLNDYDVWNPKKVSFVNDKTITIEDPFIRVRNIENIPSSVQANKSYVLSPVITTGKGLDCYNPYWDEEEATYKAVVWSVISGPATISNGILRVTGTGNIKIRATIDSGVDEEFTWYDYKPDDSTVNKYKIAPKDQYGRAYNEKLGEYSNPVYVENANPPWSPKNVKVDYVQDFDIRSTAATTGTTILAELVLIDGTSIIISDIADFMNLCNDKPSSATIPLTGNRSFVKNKVRSVIFASYPKYGNVQSKLSRITGRSTYRETPDYSTAEFVAEMENGAFDTNVALSCIGLNGEGSVNGNQIMWLDAPYRETIGGMVKYKNAFGIGLSGSAAFMLFRGMQSYGGLVISTIAIQTEPLNDTLIVAKSAQGKDIVNTFSVTPMFESISRDTTPAEVNRWGDITVDGDDDNITAEFDESFTNINITVKAGAAIGTSRVQITVPRYICPAIGTVCRRFFSDENRTKEVASLSLYRVNEYNGDSHTSGFIFRFSRLSYDTGAVSGSSLFIDAITNEHEFTFPWSKHICGPADPIAYISPQPYVGSGSDKPVSCELIHNGNTLLLDTTTKILTMDNVRDQSYLIISFPKFSNPSLHDKPHLGLVITDDVICRNIDIEVCMAEKNPFNANTSLRNFGRNFTSLTKVENIPSVSGENCMESFLRGCTSFNQPLTIPSTVTGTAAMKNFLRDCTSFNSAVTLPTGLTGKSVLHGFLRGCTSFNQPLTIPSTVTGRECLRSFLQGCIRFNRSISIPTGVSGWGCLYEFLSECSNFNQPITLPNNVRNSSEPGREMTNFMRSCDRMTSDITVPADTGRNAELSEQVLSSRHLQSNLAQTGVLIKGPGTNAFLTKVENKYDTEEWPYTHFKNLD